MVHEKRSNENKKILQRAYVDIILLLILHLPNPNYDLLTHNAVHAYIYRKPCFFL